MQPIVHIPHLALTSPAKPVTKFDKKLTKLIADMKQALKATKNPKGVGLAATQVGQPYRVFITRPKENEPMRVFINPEIIFTSDDASSEEKGERKKLEGCLSIPGVWGNVRRAPRVTLQYQDEAGVAHKESFSGFMATIIQHETDHVNGILFTKRVLEQKGKLYEAARDEEGKEILQEITVK